MQLGAEVEKIKPLNGYTSSESILQKADKIVKQVVEHRVPGPEWVLDKQ